MIIKASKRGGAKQLALHLMSPDNDHVEVLKMDGFIDNNMTGALHELYAISRATQCKKFLMSISFNPPQGAEVNLELIEDTVSRSLKKLNLEGQPYCLIAHEKEGRRHYHCVASLIDTQEMKAIKQPYYKKKLNNLAKTLFIENGWDLPQGFIDRDNRDPRNFNLAEWQQAKRHKQNPKHIKMALQQCWAISDCKLSFSHALTEAGYFLAQGDRRGYVAVDWHGEVYSLTRSLGVKTKELTARLGDHKALVTIEAVKAKIAHEHSVLHKNYTRELALKHRVERQPFKKKKASMIKVQREERASLKAFHGQRTIQETQIRQAKIRKGLGGLWDFFTGSSKKQHRRNEIDAKQCVLRDRNEKETLINQHLNHRENLQTQYKDVRQRHQLEKTQLNASLVQSTQGILQQGALKHSFNHNAKPNDLEPKQNLKPELGL